MIEAMQGVIPKGGSVIVGEPSMMKAVTGHKGGQGIYTHVVGFEVHSSIMHTGVSAILEAAKLINFATERNAVNFASEPTAAWRDVRSTLHHMARRHDRGRNRAQHHRQGLQIRDGFPRGAGG